MKTWKTDLHCSFLLSPLSCDSRKIKPSLQTALESCLIARRKLNILEKTFLISGRPCTTTCFAVTVLCRKIRNGMKNKNIIIHRNRVSASQPAKVNCVIIQQLNFTAYQHIQGIILFFNFKNVVPKKHVMLKVMKIIS